MIHPAWRFTNVPLGEVRNPVTAGRLNGSAPIKADPIGLKCRRPGTRRGQAGRDPGCARGQARRDSGGDAGR